MIAVRMRVTGHSAERRRPGLGRLRAAHRPLCFQFRRKQASWRADEYRQQWEKLERAATLNGHGLLKKIDICLAYVKIELIFMHEEVLYAHCCNLHK